MASLVAAPAGASIHKPIRGHVDMTLNLGVFQDGAAKDVSWHGTLRVRGTDYPMVYYAGLLEPNGEWVYWEDRYVIFDTLHKVVDENGIITEFEPGEVILEVHERGWGYSGRFFAIGEIVTAEGSADPHGLLDTASIGDLVVYRGHESNDGLAFTASLRTFASG
jgi:hypothetical protein